MSQENVELHRRLAETFSAGEIDAFISFCDTRIEFRTEVAAVAGCYQGHDGMRQFFRDFEEVWGEEIRVEPEVSSTLATTRSYSSRCADAAGRVAWTSLWRAPTWSGGATA